MPSEHRHHSSAAQRFKLDSNDEVTTDVGYESLCPRKILRTREVYNTDGLIDDRSPLTVKSFRALDFRTCGTLELRRVDGVVELNHA